MTPIQVIGIGLDGAIGLSDAIREMISQAQILVGSARHLGYFPDHPADRIVLGDLTDAIEQMREKLTTTNCIVVLTSGDPLFFGLGRLLLAEFPPELLTFHPHLSSIQLAFSRIKVPWQDAQVISAHGRSLDELTRALQQGAEKIAVLTDSVHSPGAIVHLINALDLPVTYEMWVCENLGGSEERVQSWAIDAPETPTVAPLNVAILLRQSQTHSLNLEQLPYLGLPDHAFLSFSDRPGLMTKREIRIMALGELSLRPNQVIWDIGAGTGSVSIEIARLFPSSQIFAIEKTAAGASLIRQNCERFQVENITVIHANAPKGLEELPAPDRLFMGGSGGNLTPILELAEQRLKPKGRIVIALATLDHLTQAHTWFNQREGWQHHLLQVQVARSVPIASLTRFSPLNPVTLLTAYRSSYRSSRR
ncbi:MAG: precorrin-6y C5,15-methyltransferase (decarboxylating) subunit CbiE [Leptolyngbyaceae cyanobacterium bins.59]|nr:precorrin-6y C5,15-methyltransferase (decarboxylating) subunit CbiE [Leptolyngbyaceae cyanobacterium bins.59]